MSRLLPLFAYGTLMDEEVWCRVAGELRPSVAGWCAGYVAYRVASRDYPGLVPGERGDGTPGRVYLDLDGAMLDRLDNYEGYRYARERVAVECADGQTRDCWAYLWREEFRHRLTGSRWQGSPLSPTESTEIRR